MENLKACPFCNGAGILTQNYSYKTRSYFVFVKCQLCTAQSKCYSSGTDAEADDWQNEACEKAIAAWNTRTEEKAAALPDAANENEAKKALLEIQEEVINFKKAYDESGQRILNGEADEKRKRSYKDNFIWLNYRLEKTLKNIDEKCRQYSGGNNGEV